ncbi:hypothetical protein TWF569_011770 [Orbilia oligospora]|nr:hypothetical protein TWF706_012002 [Orbilia oligospora]KAF3122515.1 hypothetical protein TWF594_011859 [Orbilia oligospora]KAF3127407.1 hypothetical protein TWF569_011770 [Orbilia oligospora]
MLWGIYTFYGEILNHKILVFLFFWRRVIGRVFRCKVMMVLHILGFDPFSFGCLLHDSIDTYYISKKTKKHRKQKNKVSMQNTTHPITLTAVTIIKDIADLSLTMMMVV